MTSSHQNIYEVAIKERATYTVFARGRTAAEAIRAAEKHFLSAQGIQIAPPWNVDVHDRRCEATLTAAKKITADEVLR